MIPTLRNASHALGSSFPSPLQSREKPSWTLPSLPFALYFLGVWFTLRHLICIISIATLPRSVCASTTRPTNGPWNSPRFNPSPSPCTNDPRKCDGPASGSCKPRISLPCTWIQPSVDAGFFFFVNKRNDLQTGVSIREIDGIRKHQVLLDQLMRTFHSEHPVHVSYDVKPFLHFFQEVQQLLQRAHQVAFKQVVRLA